MNLKQRTELIKAFKHNSRPVKFEERDSRDRPDYLDNWVKEGKPITISLKTEITDGTAIGVMEISYGFLCLWDGENWTIRKQACETDKYVYLGDYHGYSEGALYKRCAIV